ncbi:MAG: hypothetical protein JWN75_90 [Candidatus Saccharibacteria bacterium]|nr:hypothetical protein [Candidatus Saccharibacteria bacterium]
MTITKYLARIFLVLNGFMFFRLCSLGVDFMNSLRLGSYRSDYSQLALIAFLLGAVYVGGLVQWLAQKGNQSFKSRLLTQIAIGLIIWPGFVVLLIFSI